MAESPPAKNRRPSVVRRSGKTCASCPGRKMHQVPSASRALAQSHPMMLSTMVLAAASAGDLVTDARLVVV